MNEIIELGVERMEHDDKILYRAFIKKGKNRIVGIWGFYYENAIKDIEILRKRLGV
ncbi:MAG: hypothetical protein MJZ37_00075 [Bacilli bacterium]|nr:hypothetical protein [Bacilli bacterium]